MGLALRLPLLRFTKIEVVGNNRVATADILADVRAYSGRGVIGRFLGYSNLLAWKSGVISLPEKLLASVSVDRDFFHRILHVTVSERNRDMVWCSAAGTCKWLDKDGIVLDEAPEVRGRLITLIDDRSADIPIIGEAILPQQQFLYIKKILRILNDGMIASDKLIFDRNAMDFIAELPTGLRLLFNVRFDPEFTAAALPAVLKKVDPTKTEYIDFRIENKVYYRPRT